MVVQSTVRLYKATDVVQSVGGRKKVNKNSTFVNNSPLNHYILFLITNFMSLFLISTHQPTCDV